MRVFTFFAILCALGASSHGADFIPAREPAAGPSPVRGSEQRDRFSLPPGFEIELVASEEQGVGKPITVAWDDAGRLWTITALEYPLDGNEQPAAAKALYEKGGRDKVLVFDNPYAAEPQSPHVFADGLAMPMGILPYKDGALVGQGPDVFWMHDTDGDGRADTKEVLLTGFGVQDSHLMPHQFTRAPGGWFYLAQGAFNYSKVVTKDGRVHQFDQTRLARFTPDGMKFEDLTSGPCNIWGLVIGREGETFIQEANDYGYPVMAYHEGASYPGCSGAFKPYAPYIPSEVDFRMGGTGLSGLALSDPAGSFPGAYADVMFVANPITRKVQAIKIHRQGPWYRYELLGDFVLCADEWFRPVSIHFGPDGCLYIVDWYNKIISHNEVPRNHPERDKTRGRIWRVRHKEQPRTAVPNIAKASDGDLLKHLLAERTWQMRAAWHQIVDRGLTSLAPDLVKIAQNPAESAAHRIHAFWALEDLKTLRAPTLRVFLTETNRNFRREALRSLASLNLPASEAIPLLAEYKRDADPEVRAEVIRRAIPYAQANREALALLVSMIQPALAQPIGKSPHSGAPMKLREAYDRDFERYLIRAAFEKMPQRVAAALAGPAPDLSVDTELLMALALPKEESAGRIAELLPKLERVPNEEELLRLVENIHSAESREALQRLLGKPDARRAVLEALLKVRNRIDPQNLNSILRGPLQEMWTAPGEDRILVARAAGAFRVESMSEPLTAALRDHDTASAAQAQILRALRELNAGDPETLRALVKDSRDATVRTEALNSLVALKSDDAAKISLDLWSSLNGIQRRAALRQLTQDEGRAAMLFKALQSGGVAEHDLDAESLEKMRQLLAKNVEAQALVERLSAEFKPVLKLDGRNESFADAKINLEGPFTVETWVRLEEGINNSDGILGVPGGADFNFHDGRFRVYCGREFGDRAIARRPMVANAWTHLAVTRDAEGIFRLYINGEIDSTDNRSVTNTFSDLDIGRTGPAGGTAGEFTEYRVWNMARAAEDIRADFDRSFEGEPRPSGLVQYFPGRGPWGTLKGGAQIEKIPDAPALLNAEQARALAERFAKYRGIASEAGDLEKGRAVFTSLCAVCHSVGGQGGQIGPVLNGAAANGVETLLRAVLTPNAAMEAGYRTFRVELKDGETLDGFFISQDASVILLRQPNVEDQRIPKDKIRRSGFVQRSLMPEGLLEAMNDDDARNLFTFLKTLK